LKRLEQTKLAMENNYRWHAECYCRPADTFIHV